MRDEDVAAAFLVAGDMDHEMLEIVDAIAKQRREAARRRAMREAWKRYRDGRLAEQLCGYFPDGIDPSTGQPVEKKE
ncbi:hypothetical protein [Aquibium microcysteis]|uniref:hypothetical protein n=1 Tax=Aquibium microcysteis TaxID=675281 RepID=UPI00165CF1E8|nr:hypothetical protein [Aquibium microcysteis]